MATTFATAHNNLFGAGLDGDVTVTSSSFTLHDPDDPLNPGANIITTGVLQRDLAAGDLTINTGCVLDTNGYLLQVNGTFTNNGTLSNDGGAASATTGGAAPGLGSLGLAAAAPNGVTGSTGTAPGTWGYGGQGGFGGGLLPSSPAITRQGSGPSSVPYLLGHLVTTITVGGNPVTFGGFYVGGPGGSGAGDGTNKGGGGGAPGGALAIFARVFDNTNGTITCNGGNGGTPTVGNTYGGGGGGGGWILVSWIHNPNALNLEGIDGTNLASVIGGTASCTGGQAGSGHGTGTGGNPGNDGTVWAAIS